MSWDISVRVPGLEGRTSLTLSATGPIPVRLMGTELANRRSWSQNAEIREWIGNSRLDGFTNRIRLLTDAETEVVQQLDRYREYVGRAAKNLEQLLRPSQETAGAGQAHLTP